MFVSMMNKSRVRPIHTRKQIIYFNQRCLYVTVQPFFFLYSANLHGRWPVQKLQLKFEDKPNRIPTIPATIHTRVNLPPIVAAIATCIKRAFVVTNTVVFGLKMLE